ncbi:LysR family transcriptional regulator [Novosphingobium sp. KCTC 2891]|uniref:winged helix-turn-helix domain-containing protein n=1 Tax=Novosphingobium sp. KCTC 2891 TaxID=2989730 RepID=UPI0022221D97|nr:LysR family transcriptional regulator [Novosphingobium sp. KCTC 2891]MCW1383537.1 LysR family transcriptional regulator [Novosphingobium sp. KCTC 2891]
MAPAVPPALKIKIQLFCGDEIAMGPGKADLIDAIARTGSISAAARALGMSYRRAWLLVDTMNRCFAAPLVTTLPGGAPGSGAQVSPLGAEVLGHYRALQAQAAGITNGDDVAAISRALLDSPRPAKS